MTDHRRRPDWAHCIKNLVDVHDPDAETIVLILDNLNIHSLASPYTTFESREAKRIAGKLEIHPTQKHGSWLSIAEIELAVLSGQCLGRRLPDIETMRKEIAAWEGDRYAISTGVAWLAMADDNGPDRSHALDILKPREDHRPGGR
jgi:hypothetical protein